MTGEERRLQGLESRIGYVFEDRELALRALTHSSYGTGIRMCGIMSGWSFSATGCWGS